MKLILTTEKRLQRLIRSEFIAFKERENPCSRGDQIAARVASRLKGKA